MKRASAHRLFAAIALVFLLLSSWQAYQLIKYNSIQKAIAKVPDLLDDTQLTKDKADPSQGHSAYPEAILARANALSKGGQFESAERVYVQLIDRHKNSKVGLAARFNLANHYLTEGTRPDLPGAQARPLLEIAKQRYRDLLQDYPLHWDTRYNLERALRIAPEHVKNKQQTAGPPPKSVAVVVPDFKAEDLP